MAQHPAQTNQSVQQWGIHHFPGEIIPMALCSYCLNTRTWQKVSLKPPFLKAEQVHFSQPFLKGQATQSFDDLCGPSVAPLQPVHIFCIAGSKTEHSIPGAKPTALSRVE